MPAIVMCPCSRLQLRARASSAAASRSHGLEALRRPTLLPRRAARAAPRALPTDGGEEISDVMKADLERYQRRQAPPAPQPESGTLSSSLKETLDKILIADFFLVLFIMVWLGVGVIQSGLSGGSSFLLDAWYPLWPLLWQPAIGVLMAGALASGGMSWLQSQGQDK